MIEELKKLKFNISWDYDLKNLSKFLTDYYKSESRDFEKFSNSEIIIKFDGKEYIVPNSPELERYLSGTIQNLIEKIGNDRDELWGEIMKIFVPP